MLIATLDLWADASEARKCRILSYETGSDLEMHAYGQCLMVQAFTCTEDAMACGELWRTAMTDLEPQAA
jgi:hypothetical protein